MMVNTHALLWWLADIELSDEARNAIADPDAGLLPPHHRDPFDRMLIAKAQIEGLTLVTRDPAFADYEVAILPC